MRKLYVSEDFLLGINSLLDQHSVVILHIVDGDVINTYVGKMAKLHAGKAIKKIGGEAVSVLDCELVVEDKKPLTQQDAPLINVPCGTISEATDATGASDILEEALKPSPVIQNAFGKSTKGNIIRRKSSIMSPTKLVWDIADDMIAKNPAARRKDILSACDQAGIAYYTVRTQYNLWMAARREEKWVKDSKNV